MTRKIVLTGDGSHTLFDEQLQEWYHSKHGAIQESEHIFIKSGLADYDASNSINILEIGMGTGLNILLSILNGSEKKIFYTALEPFPLIIEEIEQLNYPQLTVAGSDDLFLDLHRSPFDQRKKINNRFSLLKKKERLEDFEPECCYDIVYFDAFGPEVQPEIWQVENFKKLFDCMNNKGLLLTYSVKGDVRRSLKESGFKVEKVKGPPGKREITRATKIIL